MIDLHTHILFGIDDGPATIEESKKMLRLASANGTRQIALTSHYLPETFPKVLDEYQAKFNILAKWIKTQKFHLELVQGHEVYLDHTGLKGIKEGKCLPINGSKYMLVEFTNFITLAKTNEMLESVVDLGFVPIIAHAERLRWVYEDFDAILDWIDNGYIIQVNGASLVNKRYKDNYKYAHRLLSKGAIHIIASDGHHQIRRQPRLDLVKDYLGYLLPQKSIKLLLYENPLNILKNETLTPLWDEKKKKGYHIRKWILERKGAN